MIMQLDNTIKSHLQQLQEAAKQNRLVIFVGAGVSASAGVPAWRELVNMFKNELPENMYDQNDILKSAQIYRELRGEVEYMSQVKKILKYGQISCNQIHKAIMELNPCHIVTTNYDDLLEQSALQNNKQYYVVAKDSHLPANQGERMLIKMHGDFREDNIVLTENDYFDYSRNFPLIRSFLLSLFSTKVVLFIGFSFDDINLKYILREVSSILESKKQRVYMLVSDEKSALAYSYFLKKGIQLLCIPSSLSESVLKSLNVEYDLEGLSHDKSIALYQSLILIRTFTSSKDDIVLSTFYFLKKYDDQIRYWGKYLKYIFPQENRQGFNISQSKLSLPYYYEDWFEQEIKNKDAETIRTEYGYKLDWLLDTLYINRVLYINRKPVFDKLRADKYDKEREKCALNIIYSLSITDIIDRVKVLKKRLNNYSIDDLELPYILFKIGRYSEAYAIYKQLAPEFWKRRKYILYFISLYNIKALSGYIINQKINNRDFDYSSFRNEISAIKLNEILTELPLDSSIKELMEKLVSGNILMENWIETARLNDQLYQQRKSAERGGISINSNIVKLLDNFEQTFFFCNENYILNECYKYSKDAYEMMTKGILNSIMTPIDKARIQTKLDKLEMRNIPLFIFMVKSSELKKILDSIVVKPIPADTDFINMLGILFGNLAEDLTTTNDHNYIDNQIISNCIKNIILMLNRTENSSCVINIYQVIINYWHQGEFIEFYSELQLLFQRQKPRPDEAIRILNCALHSANLPRAVEANYYIACMSKVANKSGKYLEEIVDAKQLDYIKDIKLRAAFLLALSEPVRQNLILQIQSAVDNLYDLCIIESNSSLHIINGELIMKLKESVKNEESIFLYTEEIACSILHRLSLTDEYVDLKKALEEFTNINGCYRFISDPINYDDLNSIRGSWLVQLSDEQLKHLLNDNEIRKVALEYCEENVWNTHFRDRIWQLLK